MYCENAKKVGWGGGGQGGCVQRFKVICENAKKNWGDVYKELIEVIVKKKKKKKLGGGGLIRGWQLVGGMGSKVGVVGDVVFGGCQPKIEGIDKCK